MATYDHDEDTLRKDFENRTIRVVQTTLGGVNQVFFEEFSKHLRMTYSGSEGPIELVKWLREMERMMQIGKTPNSEKVALATDFLEGKASNWWRQVKTSHSKVDYNWNIFKIKVKGKYLGFKLQWQKETEFMEITMGEKSLHTYTKEYQTLSMFGQRIMFGQEPANTSPFNLRPDENESARDICKVMRKHMDRYAKIVDPEFRYNEYLRGWALILVLPSTGPLASTKDRLLYEHNYHLMRHDMDPTYRGGIPLPLSHRFEQLCEELAPYVHPDEEDEGEVIDPAGHMKESEPKGEEPMEESEPEEEEPMEESEPEEEEPMEESEPEEEPEEEEPLEEEELIEEEPIEEDEPEEDPEEDEPVEEGELEEEE
ncbi:hypothetical protein RND81_07G070600 [Saponaria officinalis]|uniref:Retrotransposon gag domain-containing protein n=1 Tax=Saponaria officinalis TaxID=3572 RepID=A0AAW1JMR7_SAPOF